MLTRGEDPREENEEHPSPTIDGDAGPQGSTVPTACAMECFVDPLSSFLA